MNGQRYSAVPWLLDADLICGRDPIWQIDNRAFNERASAWTIDGCSDILLLRAERGNGNDGGLITLALSPTPRYDLYAHESFALAHIQQSNPCRSADDGA